jgi:hypothetical protein
MGKYFDFIMTILSVILLLPAIVPIAFVAGGFYALYKVLKFIESSSKEDQTD